MGELAKSYQAAEDAVYAELGAAFGLGLQLGESQANSGKN